MNFYKHYIGDFQRDTGHLSLTERGAYLALIHHYYATEKPLPSDYSALCRIAGAIDKAEKAAVKTVMSFFDPTESGLTHKRIEAEIEKAGKVKDTNRDIAVAREAKRRAEREARTEHENSTKRAQSVSRTEHENSTNQTPDTRIINTPQPPKGGITFRTWIESIPPGQDAIPKDHHVFRYAESVKIPIEFLELAWSWFERRYLSVAKKYKDWPKVFRNAVEGNWGRLWWIDNDGNYALTTAGMQLKRSLENDLLRPAA